MKRFFRNIVFTFVCALSFMFLGVATVSAAESSKLNNTNVSNYLLEFTQDGEKYFILNGDSTNAQLNLKSKKTGVRKYLINWNLKAEVSIVKCDVLNSDGSCKEWNYYNYGNDNKTTDAINQKMKLKFDSLNPSKGLVTVNGAKLSTLNSFYGLADTYFVVVRYKYNQLGSYKYYEPEIFNVVLLNDIDNINISKNGKKVTVTSGAPLTEIKYFYSLNDQTAGFDYETEYSANSGVIELDANKLNQVKAINGEFSYEFEIEDKVGHYYVKIKDSLGREHIEDINNIDNTKQDSPAVSTDNDNIANTDVGKIILISLLVVLALSLILVIVQRIVDYRKKIY